MMTKKWLMAIIPAILILALSIMPVLAQSGFTAKLSGAGEVPPVTTMATGNAMFSLSPDGTSITFTLTVNNISDVTASHIHLAPAGVNGGVVVPLFAGGKPGVFSGVLAQGTITQADLTGVLLGMPLERLITEMRAGNTYVNVHTMAHPGGEIRGQIMMQAP